MPPSSNVNTFDAHASSYREVLNKANSASGEDYEYFIQLRVNLMKAWLLSNHVFELPDSWGDILPGSGEDILDLGCGIGITENHLRRAFPACEIEGVDSSAESIWIANANSMPGISFHVADCDSLPFKDRSFELAYMNGVMHHIIPGLRHSTLVELKRVMTVGGYGFIFDNNPKNPLMMRAMHYNPIDNDALPVFPEEMREMLRGAGFTVVDTVFYFFFPRWLKFFRCFDRYLKKVPYGAQYMTVVRKY